VRVALDVVEDLNQSLAAQGTKSNAELGGILLGRTLESGETEILGYEFATSEHRRGVIYSLGLREQLLFAERAAKLSRKPDMQAVGFFRTHLRPGLFLDQDDFSLMQEVFGDASQIALLVRPLEPGPSNAGIFMWEEGDIDRRQTPLLFPFDAATLRAQGPIDRVAGPAPLPKHTPIPHVVVPHEIPARTITVRLPAIPVRWIGWGGAVALGALALGAVIPRLQIHPGMQALRAQAPVAAPPAQPQKAEEEQAAVVAAPIPAPAPQPEAPRAVFAPPSDEDRSAAAAPEPSKKPEAPRAVFAPPPLPEPQPVKTVALATPPPVAAPVAAPVVAKVAASVPAPELPVAAPTPAPAPAPAPEPVRPVVVRRPAVRVAISLEPQESSEIRKVAGHVPLFGRLAHAEGGSRFSPAHPHTSIEPRVPATMASALPGELAVDIRLSIDKKGLVTNYEVLHGAGTQFASLAASYAGASAWEPAYEGDHPVASDMIVHYRFQPGEATGKDAQ
jgi:hypothetical protein